MPEEGPVRACRSAGPSACTPPRPALYEAVNRPRPRIPELALVGLEVAELGREPATGRYPLDPGRRHVNLTQRTAALMPDAPLGAECRSWPSARDHAQHAGVHTSATTSPDSASGGRSTRQTPTGTTPSYAAPRAVASAECGAFGAPQGRRCRYMWTGLAGSCRAASSKRGPLRLSCRRDVS